MKKNILVTGGQGFVWNGLLLEFWKQGHNLTCLDIGLSKRWRKIPGVKYIHDETKNINTIFRDEYFDEIYHLWEYSRVEASYKNIDQVIESNIVWTAEVLNYWKKLKTCKLIYTASSTRYADNSLWINISPYAFTKSCNVELVKKFWLWYDLPYAITYFYNVYGDDENEEWEYATLIWIFKKAFREKRKLPVVLPWTQKRNFTHITDIIQWLILVWEKWLWDEFGIWASENYSIVEVAEMFGSEIDFLPERMGNRMDAQLVTSRLKELWWVQSEKLENYIKSHIM